MNLKLKAGLYTIGMVAGGYFGLSLIQAIFQAMPESWRETSFYVICIGLILYVVYSIVLNSLEISEKMKNIADRM